MLLCWQIVKVSLFVQKSLGELCRSKYGQRIILQLLHPDQQKYVPLHLQQIMHPPSKPASGFAASTEQETEQVRPGLVLCLPPLTLCFASRHGVICMIPHHNCTAQNLRQVLASY